MQGSQVPVPLFLGLELYGHSTHLPNDSLPLKNEGPCGGGAGTKVVAVQNQYFCASSRCHRRSVAKVNWTRHPNVTQVGESSLNTRLSLRVSPGSTTVSVSNALWQAGSPTSKPPERTWCSRTETVGAISSLRSSLNLARPNDWMEGCTCRAKPDGVSKTAASTDAVALVRYRWATTAPSDRTSADMRPAAADTTDVQPLPRNGTPSNAVTANVRPASALTKQPITRLMVTTTCDLRAGPAPICMGPNLGCQLLTAGYKCTRVVALTWSCLGGPVPRWRRFRASGSGHPKTSGREET